MGGIFGFVFLIILMVFFFRDDPNGIDNMDKIQTIINETYEESYNGETTREGY